MHEVAHYLLQNPIFAIFLSLGLGNLVGRLKIKNFSLGLTVGVLLMALIIGQAGNFKIDPLIKTLFFEMFIFTIGYEVGPSFFRSLKKTGLKLMLQAAVFAGVALALALLMFKVFRVNPGEGAGIIAGALTNSATVGTSAAALNSLPVADALKETYLSELTIAYALTYVFGAAGVLIFLQHAAPRILHADMKKETKKLLQKLQLKEDHSETFLTGRINLRVLAVEKDSLLIGRKVEEVETENEHAFVIEAIFRNGAAIESLTDEKILLGDYLVVVGKVDELIGLVQRDPSLREIASPNYRKIPLHNVTVMLTKKFSYAALKRMFNYGILISGAEREGKTVSNWESLRPEDRVRLIGMPRAIDKVLPEIGYEIEDGPKADLSYLSFGIIFGMLLGSIVLHLSQVPLTLGTGGGTLLVGLLFGWYQERHANMGAIPGPTRWFLKTVGLNLFIAIVGLESGAQFLPALKEMGAGVLLMGAVLSIAPHFVTLLFGHYVLKLNPVENIGALAGAGTHNPAMCAISDEIGSSVIALSFTPAFAVANILLTIMGPLVITILN
ncbi:MAG: aspartate-alanine antiporter [Enterococcaceae bacterium]|jgi:putative transport protein|nr:aspartate-alanine antiporter [Enterococcaceae bacterium]MCI1919406.1 aspartate-alanine antiporter [Enterococcaceae bacterium]